MSEECQEWRERSNWFGRDEGEYVNRRGKAIVVRYTKSGSRMKCTAWLGERVDKHNGKRRPPGQCGQWGEPMRDKCRCHGGKTLEVSMERGLARAGTRSKYMVEIDKKAVEMRADPGLKSLNTEIGRLRALLEMEFERMNALTQEDKEGLALFPDSKDMKRVLDIMAEVRRLVTAQDKLKYGGGYVPTVDQLQVAINQIVAIIRQEVRDAEIIRRISERFAGLTLPDACGLPESKRAEVLGVG